MSGATFSLLPMYNLQQRPIYMGPGMWLDQDNALPIIHFTIGIQTGSIHDPRKKEGLCWITSRLLRTGTRKLSASQVDQQISSLGGRLHISPSLHSVQISGTVIRKNFLPFFELVVELLARPALRQRDFMRLQREALAMFVSSLDDDSYLTSRALQSCLFHGHPYARSSIGTPRSIQGLKIEDVRTFFERYFKRPKAVLGFAGDIEPQSAELARNLLFKHGHVRRIGLPSKPRVRKSQNNDEIEVNLEQPSFLLVDKPERTQTQIRIGTQGITYQHDHLEALLIANHCFGGFFSSRLMKEIRSKRGWSYGTSSGWNLDPWKGYWSMQAAPGTTDAVACIKLMLRLFEQWKTRGIQRKEFEATRVSLVQGHCFALETSAKRMHRKIMQALLHIRHDYDETFEERFSSVNWKRTRLALQEVLNSPLNVCLTGTSKNLIRSLEKKFPNTPIKILPFEEINTLD